jgi:hypothetical protein
LLIVLDLARPPRKPSTRLRVVLLLIAAVVSRLCWGIGAITAAQAADPYYQFPHYAVSFAPGAKDADGVILGGTEIRDLVTFQGKLYAGNSYWKDQDPIKRNAQILVKDSPTGEWREELNFGDFCSNPAEQCALATGALAPLAFTADKNGTPVNVSILAASIWPVGAQTVKLYAKNNVDGKWYETAIGDAFNGQARSFGVHTDAKTGENLAFVNAGTLGIYHGWLSPQRGAGKNPITWVTGESNAEWVAADDSCTGAGERIMAFAEADGALFASKCFTVMKRIDGPQNNCRPAEVDAGGGHCVQRWVKFWSLDNPPGSESGFRGMTQVTYRGAKQWLLLGFEGGSGAAITRLDPQTATPYTELDVAETLTQAWGMPTAYIIAAYSGPMPFWYGEDGRRRRIIGLHANIARSVPGPSPGHSLQMSDPSRNGARIEADAWYFLRDAAYSYRLFKLPPIMAMRMNGIRAAVSSPWKEECNDKGQNCAIYFGGGDASKSSEATPCYVAPCNNLAPVPTHDSAFIVKGYN